MSVSQNQPLKNPLPLPLREEILNITIHSFGLFFSLIGFGIMIAMATLQSSPMHIVSASVYAVTLMLVYVASILFHTSLANDFRYKKAFEVLDHCAIYLLIAGTYTPFMLVSLKGWMGFSMLAVIWGLALSGIMYKIFFYYKSDLLSTLAYVLMGWIVIFAAQPLLAQIGWSGFALLLGGGVVYTIGALFYIFDDRFPYAHGVWHTCVLTASLLHYFAVLFFVILPGA